MYILEKISEFVGKWMAVVVLAIAALSLFLPKATLWIELSWVNYLLMVVMFGMGLTLKLSDFALVFARHLYFVRFDRYAVISHRETAADDLDLIAAFGIDRVGIGAVLGSLNIQVVHTDVLGKERVHVP